MKYLQPAFENERAEVDLTPMLDVIFIMLVFFVVTAVFLREVGIPVAVPPSSAVPPIDQPSITVIVEPASTFRVNGHVVSRGGLIPYLHAVYAQNPDATFGVLMAEGSVVRDMMTAANAGRTLGFDVINITKEE